MKEKHLKTNYRSAGIILNVNATIYFKFKLQLQFINNKNCLFVFGATAPSGPRPPHSQGF
jgi:hypothetical protein